MPSGFRPERVPGSQAERAPAPALWAGEKSREQSVSAERAEAGAARRLAGAREETRSLPPAITPRPALPPPLGTRGPQAELAPPPSLLLRADLGGEAGGAERHYCLYGSQQKGYFMESDLRLIGRVCGHCTLPGDNVRLRPRRKCTFGADWSCHSLAGTGHPCVLLQPHSLTLLKAGRLQSLLTPPTLNPPPGRRGDPPGGARTARSVAKAPLVVGDH